MATTRRRLSPAFKDEAVRLVTEAGVSVAQAARDLDLYENVLRKWVRARCQSQPSSEQAHFAERVNSNSCGARAVNFAWSGVF